ncbi:MAG TPA: glycosyltransferase [Candidatus Sulfotelmatobacter sp.]|nr:glycosyltransferase [Candidatus Sulfotelmatobacter sp.]
MMAAALSGPAEDSSSANGGTARLGTGQPISDVFLMSNSLETGGSERQFSALAGALDRQQFKVHLGCIMRKGPFVAGLGEIPEFCLGGSLYGLQSIRTRLRLSRHLKNCNTQIAHAFDFYTNLTLLPAARWARVPILIGSQRQLGDLLSWKQERAQAAILRWCEVVVCNSRAATTRLMELGLKESQLTIIRNGLPAEAFAESVPALPRVPNGFRIGMIARMNARSKNHRLFLRMAARLRSRLPDLQFVLVGDGPLRAELEREAEHLGLGGHVQFLGDRRDIPALLASIDISVLPSASESLSNVIIESMAAGVPVVANLVGGNSELVTEDRGVLVAPNNNNEEALSEAVERLLCDPALRASLGRNARTFARANFTLEQMRQRHEELYRELLERKGLRANAKTQSGAKARALTRVATVAASLRYVGGQSVQADLLRRGWKGDKNVEMQFIPIDPAFPRLLQWAERIPLLRTMIRQPIYLFKLWSGLKEADLAHIFSASYWSFLVAPAPACWVARRRGKKTLIHYHSGEARDHLQHFRSALPVLRKADRLIVPSEYLVEVFREFGLEAQAIPNIVDVSQFSFRLRRPLRPHLICTRGFHRYYCVDVVVHAFAEVQKVFPDAQLDLVGGGPLENEIRELVRNLGVSRVAFKGVAPREEIGRYYDRADIFLNASRLDNMPVSVLEAFASGMPVVTTDPEGMRYIVEHGRTGLLSPVGDAKTLAENVIRVLRDPELAERLALSALREMEHYSWPVVREQWLEVYRAMT